MWKRLIQFPHQNKGLLFRKAQNTSLSNWTKSYLSWPKFDRIACLKADLLPLITISTVKRPSLGHILSKTKGGFDIAMQIREDLPELIRSLKKTDSLAVDKEIGISLQSLDDYIRNWLSVILSIDTLQLKRVTFDHSSGDILEKVARGESVHRVRSLAELKRRLHDGRRCFALFHHCLPEDPLVFVHVGLTSQLAHTLSALDTYKDETTPQCAMFYSINSPHASLSGLDLASQLIKEAMPALQAQFPSLGTFSTLSPVPNFMKWLSGKAEDLGGLVIPDKHLNALIAIGMSRGASLSGEELTPLAALRWLHGVLSQQPSPSWPGDADLREALKEPLMWLGAHYIAREKLSARGGGGQLPLDPVARFHLRNGATFLSLNWLGNPSTPGLQSSAGLMVNYQYDAQLCRIESSAAQFESNPVVPLGSIVEKLLSV